MTKKLFQRTCSLLFPLLPMFLFLLIVFWPLFNGFALLANGISYSDLWTFNYPLKDWYRSQLLVGKMPFWTNLVGNGFPVFAEGQVGALYPPHLILFRLFPTTLAYNLNLFIHFFLAFLLTYLFGRVSLKLSRAGSFLAGLTYSLSGYFWTQIQYLNVLIAIAWLPLVFLSIERIVTTRRFLWMLILGLTFSLQIFAGHPEYCLYTVIFGFAYFFLTNYLFLEQKNLQNGKRTVDSLLLFLAALIIVLGITAIQVLPTYELSKESNRQEGLDFEYVTSPRWPFHTLSFFIWPKTYDDFKGNESYHPLTANFINPNALYGYIGLLPIIFAILAVIFWRKRMVVVFALLLLIAFFYAQGRATQVFEIVWQIVPGLKMLRFSIKAMFFVEFCLAILAGFGFDFLRSILESKFKKGSLIVLILGVLVILFTFGDLYFNNVARFRKLVKTDEWLKVPPAAKYLQTALEDKNYRFYSHGTNNLYYTTVDIGLHKEYQNLLPVNFNLLYKLPSNREYFTLFLKRQKKLKDQKTNFNSQKDSLDLTSRFKKALSLQGGRYLISDLPMNDPDLILREKFSLSKEAGHYIFFAREFSEELTTKIVPTNSIYLYENTRVYPRVAFVHKAITVKTEEEALEKVLEDDFDPLNEVILEEAVEDQNVGGNGGEMAKTKILDDGENQVKINVESGKKGFLVLADTYYPGWKAAIDGKQTKIFRANYAFRAIPVSEGKHSVIFYFEPTHWRLGMVISLGSLILVIISLGYSLMKRK